ncbi:MAG: Rpn family recombination-promoting nuclease/putative transposase [Clostridiales bacterium]|nr:Rpn family recombination-promoting nuclease/putative transposase [Clostridiales bacterium]
MLPTVDFCFKELMQNPKVRQGFIAALLNVEPETVSETTLMPTILSQESVDDKVGILDVRVKMSDGTQVDLEMQVARYDYWENRVIFCLSRMYSSQIKRGASYEVLKKCIHVSILDFNYFRNDERCYRTVAFCDIETGELYSDLMEIQILELPKLPHDMPENSDEISVYEWMKFFGGKRREDFEDMARTNEYIGEAYDTLMELSADERKRLEYEAREKALLDYNSNMKGSYDRGHAAGFEEGLKEAKQETDRIKKEVHDREVNVFVSLLKRGFSVQEARDITNSGDDIVQEAVTADISIY